MHFSHDVFSGQEDSILFYSTFEEISQARTEVKSWSIQVSVWLWFDKLDKNSLFRCLHIIFRIDDSHSSSIFNICASLLCDETINR
jgi:hypothetical protein